MCVCVCILPKGGTVMDAVIKKALTALEASSILPYLILFTDGSVPNERDICQHIHDKFEEKSKKKKLRTRIFTMGIGIYTNWYFLKMLSQMGRGKSEIVVYKEQMFAKVFSLYI